MKVLPYCLLSELPSAGVCPSPGAATEGLRTASALSRNSGGPRGLLSSGPADILGLAAAGDGRTPVAML